MAVPYIYIYILTRIRFNSNFFRPQCSNNSKDLFLWCTTAHPPISFINKNFSGNIFLFLFHRRYKLFFSFYLFLYYHHHHQQQIRHIHTKSLHLYSLHVRCLEEVSLPHSHKLSRTKLQIPFLN